MLIPRFNSFRIALPNMMIPNHLKALYDDILNDAGLLNVYSGNCINCITESVTGIQMPGMHLVLIEQTHQDANRRSAIKTYYAKGMNAIRQIDDNEIALTFRLVDGFHNYYLLDMAIAYSADDTAQHAIGETYKSIGDLQFRQQLSNNYELVRTYQTLVYSSIDAQEFAYNAGASEKTFTIRLKFVTYKAEMFKHGKSITENIINMGR